MIVSTTPTLNQWDAFVATHPRAHILQQSAWGDLKATYGWNVEQVALTEGERIVAGAQILFRALPFHLGKMAYLPMGPYTPKQHEDALWKAIDQRARKRGAAFLKWEPGIYGAG